MAVKRAERQTKPLRGRRMNIRVLEYVGRNENLLHKKSSKVYVVATRENTVYTAHGSMDSVNYRCYPKYLKQFNYRAATVSQAVAEARSVVAGLKRKYYDSLTAANCRPILWLCDDGLFAWRATDGSVKKATFQKNSASRNIKK